jgi:hypothetical protein
MHIVTPFFITCSDPTSRRERVWGIVCIRWSKLVGVVNCHSNFMFFYGVYQFHGYLAREKKNACAIILSDR